VLTSLKAMLLACAAAAVAWWLAHDVLGHPRPFFAPIAAAISLTTSRLEPSARIAQMVGGVLIGILSAEALHGLLGSSPLALGVIALLAMVLARAIGGGFLSESVFFVNQAVGSAILVVALDRTGSGAERAIDALVGGAVAYLISALLLPISPFTELTEARRQLIRRLRRRLDELDQSTRLDPELGEAWVLDTWEELQGALAGLTSARRAARVNRRAVPWWWPRRAAIDAEIRRSEELDLLAVSALGLVRLAVTMSRESAIPSALCVAIAQLNRELAGADDRSEVRNVQ
jgi:uncharacterized membrane protein YgaE (UPF0421/DUF939 family)